MNKLHTSFAVVSLVYNRQLDVLYLLESLQNSTLMPKAVYLIDNGSKEPLQIETEKYPFPIHVYRIQVNEGIAGYNKGFELAKTDYILAVDSDVTLAPQTLEIFEKALVQNQDLILAGAKILDATTHQTMFDNPIHGAQELPGGGRFMMQFNGCCFLANRKAWLDLGGFDRRLYIYVNEWDLTLKAFSNYKPQQIRYFPEAIAYHKTAPSQDRSQLYMALIRRNEFWIRWKYYPLISALDYSLRFYGGSIRRLLPGSKENKQLFWQYMVGGTKGLAWVLRERKKLSPETYNRLMKMRAECTPPENLSPNF